ncbi:HNH endonuclease signature motif containing protein [Agrococcus sp. ARC_14]|uniref:HNH endonuclease signature motif containing protein n=1 Tax=Agrococcus sp. ARC_14 TaxID=2919927 RepID=UPI001F05D601|nr:HNH endonuclease signature motif containing protein [Agrococcus sp. ARC_14]MCH1881934.1 HNH endonuclease [Agrococcus sp. ARC_14]
MSTDAVQQPGAESGPEWLRGPRPAELAAALESTEPEAAPAPVTARAVAETAIRALVEVDAAIASLQAMRTQLLAGIGHVAIDDALAERLDPAVGLRDDACEIGLLQRRSDRTVEGELTQSMLQMERWPATIAAWGRASIHRGHVRVIEDIGAPLRDAAERAAFEAALIPQAEQTTPGRLRMLARRELEQYLTEPLAARHAEARTQRDVTVTDLDHGMSMVRGLLPTVLAHGIVDRLTQMARATGADDPRSFAELRADLFADLLLTADPNGAAIAGITALVSVVIPTNVLLGDDQQTGDDAVARLSNGAPIDPETARLLAGRTKLWTRLFTDPLRGHVVAVDSYKPSRRLRALLRARDQHCRWPGCTAKAVRCDIDHTVPWAAEGKTEHGNLAHLCRRHHVLKGAQLSGARRWKVEQVTPGVLAFTSPTGEVYIDQPPQVGPVFGERAPEAAPEPAWGAVVAGAQRVDLPF